MTRSVLAIGLAGLLLLAGCASGVPSGIDGSGPAAGDDSAEMGQMNFYVSDEPNAMDDFEHLNVTISAVAFHKANASADGDDATPENESEDGDENTTTTEDENATTTTEIAESADGGEVADKNESDEWVVEDVDNETVDLTQLQGKNATLLSQFDIPAGEYDMAMVYVSDVNATLKTGEQVNVKLPSEKLQVKTPFTIGANESVDFVFDISVHEAGGSGKYILKPVVSESGANVEKRVVGEDDDEGDEGTEAALDVSVDGNVSAGENVTVTVTNDTGEPVEGADVKVNGDVVGQTDADGQLTFTVPDAEDVEIEVESEAGEGELTVELGGDSDESDESENADAGAEVELAASFTTNVTAGENATVAVTDGDGAPVEDAVVEVNGEVVGETNADGELTFEVPADADDLEVVITKGDAELELEQGVVAAASA